MRDVVRHLIDALEQDRELILCQVVETRGSTPQKAGALMVINPEGGQVGTLGGGCVENEVKMKAIRQLGGSMAAVHSFVLDHDYAWADGLICGGRMVIVTQSVRGPAPLAYFRSLDLAIEQGNGFTEAVVVGDQPTGGPPVGTRFLLDGAGQCQGSWPESPVPAGLASQPCPAHRSAQADGQGRHRVLAAVASHPAGHRRRRARGRRRSRACRRRPTLTSGSSTTAISTPIEIASRLRSESWSVRSRTCSPRSR